jgi:hypothetical protein
LHHVVPLGLAVNIDVKAELVLDLNALLDLLPNKFVVLLLGDLALGEFVSLNSDLLSLFRANIISISYLVKQDLVLDCWGGLNLPEERNRLWLLEREGG